MNARRELKYDRNAKMQDAKMQRCKDAKMQDAKDE